MTGPDIRDVVHPAAGEEAPGRRAAGTGGRTAAGRDSPPASTGGSARCRWPGRRSPDAGLSAPVPCSLRPVAASTLPSPSGIRVGYQRPCAIAPQLAPLAGDRIEPQQSARPIAVPVDRDSARFPPADNSVPSGRKASPPQKKSNGSPSAAADRGRVGEVGPARRRRLRIPDDAGEMPLATSPKSCEASNGPGCSRSRRRTSPCRPAGSPRGSARTCEEYGSSSQLPWVAGSSSSASSCVRARRSAPAGRRPSARSGWAVRRSRTRRSRRPGSPRRTSSGPPARVTSRWPGCPSTSMFAATR